MMIKFWFLLVLIITTTISARRIKNKRSIFEPWLGPPSFPSYGNGAPWSSNPPPWRTLKTEPDLYPSPSKWSLPKPPPVVITKEVRVPVDKFIPVEVAKYIPYPVEKIVPVPVNRIVQVPVDRIVRVPVEVPATPAPMPQMVAVAQAPPIQSAAPAAMSVQQAMPMIRSGMPFTVPILITAQGLSISTSGLINSAGAMDQTPVPVAAPIPASMAQIMAQPMMQTMAQPMVQAMAQPMVQAMAQPMVQAMAQPMVQAMAQPMVQTMAPPGSVSNNSTVGISFILNGIPPRGQPQGITQGLTFVNALPDVAPESIQGNSLGPEVALSDYGIIDSLVKHGGGFRWKRNTYDE